MHATATEKDKTALRKTVNWELINLLRTVILELLYGNNRALFASWNRVITGGNLTALQMESWMCETRRTVIRTTRPKVTQASLYTAREEKNSTALLFSHLTCFLSSWAFPRGKWMTGLLCLQTNKSHGCSWLRSQCWKGITRGNRT